MSAVIPKSHQDLIEGPVVVSLVTVMPDGQPQATPVWCLYEGGYVEVNTARGRQKEKNMRARPMATVLAIDPQNDQRYLEIRGRVEEITEAGAIAHADRVAMLYANQPHYGGVAAADLQEKEVRVICRIKPVRVTISG